MVLTSVEIIALSIALLGLIKLFVIIIKPSAWSALANKVYGHPKITIWASLILSAFVLNLLLKEVTITQIFAVTAFLSLLILAGASIFNKELLKLKDSVLQRSDVVRKEWWYLVLWVILILWVLEEILVK